MTYHEKGNYELRIGNTWHFIFETNATKFDLLSILEYWFFSGTSSEKVRIYYFRFVCSRTINNNFKYQFIMNCRHYVILLTAFSEESSIIRLGSKARRSVTVLNFLIHQAFWLNIVHEHQTMCADLKSEFRIYLIANCATK